MKNVMRKLVYLNTILGLLLVSSWCAESVLARKASSPENHRVKIWVKSFIPFPRIDMTRFGPCFTGDDRSFSEKPDASCRTHQEIEFEVTPYKLLNQTSFTGKTHKVDCRTNNLVISAQARSNRLRNGPVTVNGQTVRVKMALAANNPLVFGAPDVDLDISLDFDWPNSAVIVAGRHDGFPAFEIYMSLDGGAPTKLYQFDPTGNSFLDHLKLFAPMEIEIKPVRQSLIAQSKRP